MNMIKTEELIREAQEKMKPIDEEIKRKKRTKYLEFILAVKKEALKVFGEKIVGRGSGALVFPFEIRKKSASAIVTLKKIKKRSLFKSKSIKLVAERMGKIIYFEMRKNFVGETNSSGVVSIYRIKRGEYNPKNENDVVSRYITDLTDLGIVLKDKKCKEYFINAERWKAYKQNTYNKDKYLEIEGKVYDYLLKCNKEMKGGRNKDVG